jgi:GNAT superfamily N-acetyltransferase
LDGLWQSAWGSTSGDYVAAVLPRSLVHLGAYSDGRLIGFVNVAWDGGKHAFILDPSVDKDHQRQGIASRLVRDAADLARARGVDCLHADWEPHLTSFYRACGFQPTEAGLIRLK